MQELREAQLNYELESDSTAQAKRLRELIDASASGDTELPKAHALIGRMCSVVAEKLQSMADDKTRGLGGKYKTWLRALPLDVAAVIAIRECIRMCSSPETYIHIQDLTSNVGKLWELEVRILQAEAVNPLYMKRIHDQIKENCTRETRHIRNVYNVAIERVFKGTLDLSLNKSDMMHLGKFGVDACYEAGLIEVIRGTNRKGTSVSYKLADPIIEFLQDYTVNDVRNIISKEDSRMICPPEPWTNLGDGGYLSIRRKSVAPLLNVRKLRKSERAKVAEQFTAEKMPVVFEAGNYLQSIGFHVHSQTMQSILRVWASGGGTMGVPNTAGPIKPEFPYEDTWDKETAPEHEVIVFNKWKRDVAMHYHELREWRGKIREVGSFLKITRQAVGTQWFPVYFDSRGRWYYRGVPNPQGSDLAKAVLHFDKKKPLGARGLFWLKVHIANSFGYDKERMQDRARWTEQNWKTFEQALDNPEDNPEIWGEDAPWCTFAACWELREALRSPQPHLYETGIPIHMDATCSGLQHFSAILRDPVGARYVNLDDQMKCGPKQDIYSKVATNTLAMIKLDADSADPEIARIAQWCLKVGISRDMAKKPVMTYVYGATLRGTAEHIEMVLLKKVLPTLDFSWIDPLNAFKDCLYIARKLFQGIATAVPAAAAAMQWLRDITSQIPNGQRMTWSTPTGFIVQHDYQAHTDIRIRLNSCGIVQTWVRDWTDGTIAREMQNAISPNFIHALDASHLTLVVNAMKRDGLQVVAIHDSFGTHACDVDLMHTHIREQFVHMYSGPNVLAEFLWDVQCIGEAPMRGTFNLLDVLDSEFMFS